MPYTLYVILLVLLGVSTLIGLIFLIAKIRRWWLVIPALLISFIVAVVTDLSLKGSKLFIIMPDRSLKRTIVFSNQEYTFTNGKSVNILANYNSYILNDSKEDFFLQELVYGSSFTEKVKDSFIETYSSSMVPFRILSHFGTEDKPLESISVSRGTPGDVKYWLRKATDTDPR